MRYWTREQVLAMFHLYENGMPVSVIAADESLSRSRIYQLFHKFRLLHCRGKGVSNA